MSLEQAITDHASALRELAAAIRSTISGAHDVGAATDKVIADAKKPAAAAASSPNGAKPETTEKKADAREAINSALAKARAEKTAETKPEAEAIDYDQVKAKVLALAQSHGRDTLVALLQRYGAAKAPDLKPMQYADFIKDIDGINDGTYDPVAAEAELA